MAKAANTSISATTPAAASATGKYVVAVANALSTRPDALALYSTSMSL